jgi:uncharacterized protein (DUF1684 family)
MALDFSDRINRLRAERLADLTAPGGWLSLIGLEWLKSGRNAIGAGDENDVRLSVGPAHLGAITQAADGSLSIVLRPDTGALIDGKPLLTAALLDDTHSQPTEVSFGSVRLFAIERAGRKGIRIENSQAASRVGFRGLEYFPIDQTWLIEAGWHPFGEPLEVEILSVTGTLEKQSIPGKAVFQRDGRTWELLPVQESSESLFFMFADLTSGKETYGAGRYLDAAMPPEGIVTLDFNLARNPPCAFTPYATCPLAPRENRLDLRVTAGEKMYRGEHA